MPAVAVIQTAFIGDVVLATPLFEAARAANPGDKVIVVVKKGCENLVENNPHVDEIIVWDKRDEHAGISGTFHLAKQLRERHIETVLIPHRSVRSGFTAWIAGIRRRIGFAKGGGRFFHTCRAPYRYGLHEVERNLMLAGAAGWETEGFTPALFPDDHDRAVVDRMLDGIERFCVIAPGSVWPTKMWPEDSYLGVGPIFAGRGLTVVVSGGPDDREVCRRVAGGTPGALDACAKLTLRQSAELYRRAQFLLTGDTAPQHIAAAMGTRVFSLFGPTVKRFGFWPYSEHGVVIEDPNVDCRPCGAHGHIRCPEGTHDCMRRITPEQVVDIIDRTVD